MALVPPPSCRLSGVPHRPDGVRHFDDTGWFAEPSVACHDHRRSHELVLQHVRLAVRSASCPVRRLLLDGLATSAPASPWMARSDQDEEVIVLRSRRAQRGWSRRLRATTRRHTKLHSPPPASPKDRIFCQFGVK